MTERAQRKKQVLDRLREADGAWVNGPDIMNEACGGQRGGARVKELRDDGYLIDSRPHPDPNRDIWQYRFVAAPEVEPRLLAEPPANHIAEVVSPLRAGGIPAPRNLNPPCPRCGEPFEMTRPLAVTTTYAEGYCRKERKWMAYRKEQPRG